MRNYHINCSSPSLPYQGSYRDWEASQVALCAALLNGDVSSDDVLSEPSLNMVRLAALILPGHNRQAARLLLSVANEAMQRRGLVAMEPSDMVRAGLVADLPRYKRALAAVIPWVNSSPIRPRR